MIKGQKAKGSPLPGLPDGARIEVLIERILPGGLGLAHFDGATIFVYLAAPGDRLSVVVEKTRGAVTWATIEKMLDEAIKVHASPETLADEKSYAERQLSDFKKRMDKDTYAQTCENVFIKRLREVYGLPRLSLFYL